jgi:hypothetical protein
VERTLRLIVLLISVAGLAATMPTLAGAADSSTGVDATAGMPPSPPIGPVSVEPGVDRPGADYEHFAMPDDDPKRCSAACENDHRCAAYTYVRPGFQGPDAICWLKASVPQSIQNNCCISGKR